MFSQGLIRPCKGFWVGLSTRGAYIGGRGIKKKNVSKQQDKTNLRNELRIPLHLELSPYYCVTIHEEYNIQKCL